MCRCSSARSATPRIAARSPLRMPSQERQPAASLTPGDLEPILSDLSETHAAIGQAFPGDPEARQPVHTVYGGAHLFRSDTPQKLGSLAIRALDTYAANAWKLAAALGMPDQTDADRRHLEAVRSRVAAKLRTEPVEDFRIDFEDGYGHRPAAEEDGHSASAALAVAAAAGQGTLPPFIGIRIKPLSKDLHERSLRTLDLFVTTLAARGGIVVSIAAARHASQDRRAGAGDRRGARLRAARAPARAASRDAAAGADDRDAAIDRLRRRDVAAARVRRPPATAGSPACTSAPMTTPRSAASRRRGRTCAIPPATSRGG